MDTCFRRVFRHTYVYIVIFLTLLGGCANSGARTNQSAEVTQPSISKVEEYPVYSSLIEKEYGSKSDVPVVVENLTSLDKSFSGGGDVDSTLRFIAKNMGSELAQEAIDDLRSKNMQAHSLTNRFATKVECILISKEEQDELARHGDFWNEFAKKYKAQAIVTFSRVGFNRDMNQALVYAGEMCWWKCGHGDYVLLMKENGVWVVKHRVNVWTS